MGGARDRGVGECALRPARSLFLAVGLVALPASGCGQTVSCDSGVYAVGVVIHAGTSKITSIIGGGVCARDSASPSGAQLRCIPQDFSAAFTPGCERYQLLPHRAGSCTIEVRTADGRSASIAVTIVDQSGGTCGTSNSFYTSRPEDSEWYLDRSDAGVPVDGATGG